jgi:hypothetical protein
VAWDKDKPSGGQKIRLSDEEIRGNWAAIETQFGNDHDFGASGTGEHVVITLQKQTSDPTNAANKGYVYSKLVGTHVELFYEDDDGNVTQLTSAGALITFPAGTAMLFYQDTAPTGWTIDDTLNDKIVFVTKGSAAGGETGGGEHSTGSWTISGLTNANESSHTHSMQSHTHNLVAGSLMWASGFSGYTNKTGAPSVANTGAGSSHTHAISADGAWRPAAYCCIIATKD